jgi:hypothetical protein
MYILKNKKILETLMCYVHIKYKIIRLNFILFIYYIDLIVIFRWEMYINLIKSDNNLIK